ncbi:hypothetical protein [Aeromonas sanarellii]
MMAEEGGRWPWRGRIATVQEAPGYADIRPAAWPFVEYQYHDERDEQNKMPTGFIMPLNIDHVA